MALSAARLCDTSGVAVPYELSHPERIFVLVTVGALAVGEAVNAFRVRRGGTLVSLREEAVFRAMFVGGILLFPAGQALAPGAVIGGGVWHFILGAVLAWLGLLLRWWSFVTLGRYFTLVVMTSEDQPVVDRGPYRVLRHPSYTGLLLIFAGVGLMLGNWVSAVGAVALISVALIYRLRREERALSAALGDRYREFAASRARLVPYVW